MPQSKAIHTNIIFTTFLLLFTIRLLCGNPITRVDDADRQKNTERSRGKRSFFDIQCKGIYNQSIFANVDQICEDCYNLFREARLHTMCREKCFSSDIFKGCVDVLLLTDELDKIQGWIRRLNGLGVLNSFDENNFQGGLSTLMLSENAEVLYLMVDFIGKI